MSLTRPIVNIAALTMRESKTGSRFPRGCQEPLLDYWNGEDIGEEE